MKRLLSFDDTPPLSVPLRFFLTAPLFAIAAALLLLWQGPAALTSRWSPDTLALTHLLTLGFLVMTMVGSLLQILPVVAGVMLPRQQLSASLVHGLLSAGALTLSAAFLAAAPWLFKLALLLLGAAFLWLLVACALGLWFSSGTSATLAAVRLALIALLLTVGLGLTLASGFAWSLHLPLLQLTKLHVIWGLLGWVGLLVIGVAYQVVPMFQVTPVYSPHLTRWLAPLLFVLLLAGSAIELWLPGQASPWATLVAALIAIGFMLFSGATLYLQWRRKRPKADVTILFWRAGLGSLLLAVALWVGSQWMPDWLSPLTLGMLFIVGFVYSVINGMLYKIVPFLVWYHLQSQVTGRGMVPNVKLILPDAGAKRQFYAHLVAVVLLVAATIWPAALTQVAALAFGFSSCWLLHNMLGACRIYRQLRRASSQQLSAA